MTVLVTVAELGWLGVHVIADYGPRAAAEAVDEGIDHGEAQA